MRRLMPLACSLLLLSSPALAGGFQILEHSAISTGMANARTALADDVSAVYFNPAAVSELPGLQLQLGLTGITPAIHYDAAGNPDPPRVYPSYENGAYTFREVNDGLNSTDAKPRTFTPLHVYASFNLEDYGLTIAYGLNNPFGLGTHWPADFDGRFITTDIEIQTFFNQPTLSVDVARLAGFRDKFHLSLAVGYDYVYATAELAKQIDLRAAEPVSLGQVRDPEGTMRMHGTAHGHGFNAALYAELPDQLAFGFSIRSGVRLPFSGTARFSFNPAGAEAVDVLNLTIPDRTSGDLDLDLPWNMNFGLAYLGVENLKVAIDVYAALFKSYKSLELKFGCIEDGTCSDTLDAGPIAKDWGTAWQFSLGIEYTFIDALAVRLGYGTVLSPVPDRTYDPALPDGRRDLFAAGVGYRFQWFKVDLGYMLALWDGVKNNDVGEGDNNNPEGKANGKYSTVTHIAALSLSASF